jgi:hypothetical protein
MGSLTGPNQVRKQSRDGGFIDPEKLLFLHTALFSIVDESIVLGTPGFLNSDCPAVTVHRDLSVPHLLDCSGQSRSESRLRFNLAPRQSKLSTGLIRDDQTPVPFRVLIQDNVAPRPPCEQEQAATNLASVMGCPRLPELSDEDEDDDRIKFRLKPSRTKDVLIGYGYRSPPTQLRFLPMCG